MDTRAKGRTGEDRAIEYLLANGYTVVSRNYQSRDGEIDCVARDRDGTLAFIEVKRAYSPAMGHPFWRVTPFKQRRLVRQARRYLADHGITNSPCRFDVIGITGSTIEHLKNAFLA
jgi:putative endonuclease